MKFSNKLSEDYLTATQGGGVCFYVVDTELFRHVELLSLLNLHITEFGNFEGYVLIRKEHEPVKSIQASSFYKDVCYFQKQYGVILIPDSMNEMGDYLSYYKKSKFDYDHGTSI